MDPITPIIERCEKRLSEIRDILHVWNDSEYNVRSTGLRVKLQKDERDLSIIIQALYFYRHATYGGPKK